MCELKRGLIDFSAVCGCDQWVWSVFSHSSEGESEEEEEEVVQGEGKDGATVDTATGGMLLATIPLILSNQILTQQWVPRLPP